MLYSKLWKSTKRHDILKFWTKHGLTCLLWDQLFWAHKSVSKKGKIRCSKSVKESAQNQRFWRVFYDKMHALRWFWCVFLKGIVHFQQLADDRATAASGRLGRTATSLHFYTFLTVKSFEHNVDPTFYSAYFDDILLIKHSTRFFAFVFLLWKLLHAERKQCRAPQLRHPLIPAEFHLFPKPRPSCRHRCLWRSQCVHMFV